MAINHEDIDTRVERVRAVVAFNAEGLEGDAYRAFFERLIADAEGWRMELDEMGQEDGPGEDED